METGGGTLFPGTFSTLSLNVHLQVFIKMESTSIEVLRFSRLFVFHEITYLNY